jgi:hypothetical protein
LRTYSVLRNISSSKSTEKDKSDLTTTTVVSQMILNLEARKMQMNNSIYAKNAAGQSTGALLNNAIYIADETLYIQGLFPTDPELWSKTALTDNVWELQNQARQVMGLVQAQNTTILTPETITLEDQAIPCSVFQVNLGLEALWLFLVNQPGIRIPSSAPDGVAYGDILKHSEMKLWISQKDNLPVQAAIQANIQVDPSQVPSYTAPVTLDITLDMKFSAYNQPVTIDLPAAATAPDVPDLSGLQPGE